MYGMDGSKLIQTSPVLLWILFIICTSLLCIIDISEVKIYSFGNGSGFESEINQKSPKGFLVYTDGCRIPDMSPFDDSVAQYIVPVTKPNCNYGLPAIFDSNYTSIFLVNTSLAAYGIDAEDVDFLQCCYRPFWRAPPQEKPHTENIIYGKCVDINEEANIKDEFIKVTCSYNNSIIYIDFFAFVPIKGLDAVSRINLLRQMPKTAEYLKHLSAVSLLGYNKVEDNTFPNLIPVLTGMNITELHQNCWEKNTDFFDNCSFIWDQYKKEGFLTSFGEDASWMGLFNYVKRGFNKQPTDYMWSTYNKKVESIIGNEHKVNVHQCVGSRQVYKTLLEYIDKFVVTLDEAGRNYFAFFWGASLSHDDFNMPSLGDEDYYNFFKKLVDDDRLKNTVLIFMSDHGIRWGPVRNTYQGRIEERLPFLYILLPNWYKSQFQRAYKNLLYNIRKLTTPFDLYETLKELLHPFELTDHNRMKQVAKKSRGYSLFTVISSKRTCEEAGIASHWCTCQESYRTNINSSVIFNASYFIVSHINELLKGYGQCEILKLKTIKDARVMSHGKHMLRKKSYTMDYMVTIETEPGNAVFESTVRKFNNNNSYEVIGTISRLNLYGKQSKCITDFHLKLFCYCKSI